MVERYGDVERVISPILLCIRIFETLQFAASLSQEIRSAFITP
jgi:hypothetical protein